MNTTLKKKYCVGLGEILFDVLPTGSQLAVLLPTLLIMLVSMACHR